MTKEQYLKRAFEAFNSGRISAEAYDCMVANADDFTNDDESN